ncbi:KilA-N domain-containing protein [Gallibacterium genomosp. 1]|uniref:KilA-N domain-containing protein n=1 Tax=Gallibacterium genomosp. 1 TaxID=155515 RepID=A0AB36DVN8_9PAST|nr:KilA-N domain-containing protein [Gallibacterium genomosp. 1]OBX00273.1 hypothetical protein QV04_06845 [Gallibacterium genomosp. 1]OBX00473.1 hypothetical protein QV05_07750 [Gallibacterium genomosp. 1]
MSNLQILSNQIRKNGNLYSLNDLHIASGSENKHRPALFIRLETTKELIAEMENENQPRNTILVVKNGLGSYACKELVIAYAAWISPAFHLVVLRAFLNQIECKPQQIALPEPEKTITLNWTENELKRLASFWCAAFEMHQMLKHIEPGLRTIGSSFASTVYTQVSEYQSTLDLIHARLQVDIDPLQYTDPQNAHWQYCLNTINNYKPRAKLIPVRKYNF